MNNSQSIISVVTTFDPIISIDIERERHCAKFAGTLPKLLIESLRGYGACVILHCELGGVFTTVTWQKEK